MPRSDLTARADEAQKHQNYQRNYQQDGHHDGLFVFAVVTRVVGRRELPFVSALI
jgi:hypothetical protein